MSEHAARSNYQKSSGVTSVISTNLNLDEFKFSQIDNPHLQTPTQYDPGSVTKGIKGASGKVREIVTLNPNDDDDDGDEGTGYQGRSLYENSEAGEGQRSVVDLDSESCKSFQVLPPVQRNEHSQHSVQVNAFQQGVHKQTPNYDQESAKAGNKRRFRRY